MKTLRTNTSHTAPRITAVIGCTIGLFIASTAHAQQYDMRTASNDVNNSFNFIEAWGSIPVDGESAMALISDASDCTMADNGLSCTEYRVGLSLYNDGDVTPSFENFGTLSDVYVRDLPLEYSYSEHNLADLAFPDGVLTGEIYFQEGLIAGTLTTPTGYEMAVSGAVILNVVYVTSPQDIIIDSVFFVPTKEWYSLDAAIDAMDQQADGLWDYVTESQTGGQGSGAIDARIIAEFDDCWKTYQRAKKRCLRAYNTELINIANVLDTCLDNVGLWDAVSGAAVGAGVGGVTGAGGTAAWTWWAGPFSGVATTVGGIIGGVVGGFGGAIAGPAEARDECRDASNDSRENAKNEYNDCKENAADELIDCLTGE